MKLTNDAITVEQNIILDGESYMSLFYMGYNYPNMSLEDKLDNTYRIDLFKKNGVFIRCYTGEQIEQLKDQLLGNDYDL